MNITRYLIAAIALFAYIFAYESFVHGHLLMGLYNQTPTIWREYSQMMNYIPYNLVIMALIALWITFIFTRFYAQGGWKNGLHFGFYLGVLAGLQAAGAYYYLPVSATLAAVWFVVYAVQSTIGGLIIGAIYRK